MTKKYTIRLNTEDVELLREQHPMVPFNVFARNLIAAAAEAVGAGASPQDVIDAATTAAAPDGKAKVH